MTRLGPYTVSLITKWLNYPKSSPKNEPKNPLGLALGHSFLKCPKCTNPQGHYTIKRSNDCNWTDQTSFQRSFDMPQFQSSIVLIV